MSFDTMNKADLTEAAKTLGVSVAEEDTKADIKSKLDEAGLSFEDYEAVVSATGGGVVSNDPGNVADSAEQPQEPDENGDEQVLVKMDRANHTYIAGTHTFTKSHPFIVMDKKEAETFVKEHEGFRLASPSEAENFYA